MSITYVPLTCVKCKKSFSGRKPADSSTEVLCSECTTTSSLPVIEDPNTAPSEVCNELSKGKGTDD